MWERVVSSAFSTQMPLASADDYRVFDLSRERRKKRADVEIFGPILAKFAPSRVAQKSCTARSCAYKKFKYRN